MLGFLKKKKDQPTNSKYEPENSGSCDLSFLSDIVNNYMNAYDEKVETISRMKDGPKKDAAIQDFINSLPPMIKACIDEGLSFDEYMKVHNVNLNGEPLDELVDGDLPFGWYSHMQDRIKQIEAEHYKPYYDQFCEKYYSPDPRIKAEACRIILKGMDNLQAVCDGIDECFSFWCHEMHTGASKEHYKEKLADLEANMDKYVKDYEDMVETRRLYLEFSEMVDRETLLDIIRQHGEIMQTDIYKMYDHPQAKNVLSEMLYFMAKDGLIERTKSGRSYLLKVK